MNRGLPLLAVLCVAALGGWLAHARWIVPQPWEIGTCLTYAGVNDPLYRIDAVSSPIDDSVWHRHYTVTTLDQRAPQREMLCGACVGDFMSLIPCTRGVNAASGE